jgi:hypothetical protein
LTFIVEPLQETVGNLIVPFVAAATALLIVGEKAEVNNVGLENPVPLIVGVPVELQVLGTLAENVTLCGVALT